MLQCVLGGRTEFFEKPIDTVSDGETLLVQKPQVWQEHEFFRIDFTP
jgi:hypothetical protein